MNRRETIGLVGAAAVAALWPGVAPARMRPRKTLIDGNLVAPIDDAAPLDAATAAQIRSSSLTAFKMTLGGSGNRSKAETDEEIAAITKGIALNPELLSLIRSSADLDAARRTGRTGVILSFEAAEMLEGKIESIDHFRAAGVLVMGLSYNGISPFGSGPLAPGNGGLTPLGGQAIQRMNALGITVNLSHSNEATSVAALAVSNRPVAITHAGCAAIHAHPRNKSDSLLRALADHGGVVGLYELSYLVAPPAQPALDDYLAHLTHAVNICGEDHVGIGTDGLLTPFDTSPESMAAWNAEIARRKATGVGAPGEGPPPFVIGLNRPDRYAVIADALRRRGYRSRTIDKILGTNFERLFRETWRLPG